MLIAKNISKKFSGVVALANISMELHPGKVNAIIGENGAGKSTLMKILSGVHTQYEGEIIFHNNTVKFNNSKEAEDAGISIIHQELNLVPHLSIAENIFLGRELTNSWGMVKEDVMNEKTTTLLTKLNLDIDPSTKIAALKVGQQQLVEIAKALYTNAEVIIMDEPTSAISDKEVENLFSIINQLKTEGKIIVYISHKFKELFTIADRYVVLRDGSTIDSGNMNEIDQHQLIQKMTGRNIRENKRVSKIKDQPVVLTAKNISLTHSLFKTKKVLNKVSFELHKGEILGIYGLMGAGRTELMECIFGLHPKNGSGEILVNDTIQKITCPADAMRAGIALVPEDRKLHGLIIDQSIRFNISISVLETLQKWGLLLHKGKEDNLSEKYIRQLSIKTASENQAAKSLSGGNQQKIVLAKWLATHPHVLLLDEPTRGIDVNAKAEIYELMKTLAAEGMGIVIVSSELPEILSVADTVLVISEGELTANLPIEEASEAIILKHAIHKN